VVRLYAIPSGLPEFRRCVQDAAGVQRLYVAILALPAKGNGFYSCPKGAGSDYYLTFLAGSNVVRMMTLETGGCRFLSLSDTDVRLTDDTFQQEFAELVGL
jgi:hypothetical protein